jgi:dinuclear metal center YbgI/SA1388 family protein
MVHRDKIVACLDDLLKPMSFKDACPNGLQVYGRGEIERVATCTSVSAAFFEKAQDAGAHLLLVHHGLFWEGTSRAIDPLLAKRLRILLNGEMNLVAYHLPLDAHPKLGNNAQLAEMLGLKQLDFEFGRYKGTPIGCAGNLENPVDLKDFSAGVAGRLEAEPVVVDAGPGQVRRVMVVSGGAGDIPMLLEAVAAGCDTYVTGTVFEQSVAVAREARLNVLALGHYNSEKLGVRAVGDLLTEELGVDVVHLDVPNPV